MSLNARIVYIHTCNRLAVDNRPMASSCTCLNTNNDFHTPLCYVSLHANVIIIFALLTVFIVGSHAILNTYNSFAIELQEERGIIFIFLLMWAI